MSQSRIGSLTESAVNITIGYWVAIGSQIVVFPQFGIEIPLRSNLWIGAWFTVISLARSYAVRRMFNSARATR